MTKLTILLLILCSLSLPSYAFPPSECTGWRIQETTNGTYMFHKRGLKITSIKQFIDKAEKCANLSGFIIDSFYTESGVTFFILKRK